MEAQNLQGRKPQEKELTIDLSEIVQSIIKGKWVILITSFVFAVVGAVYALSLPNLYTSEVKILPELDSKDIGGLSKFKSLAGLAGVDLSSLSSTEAIRPDLYPNILQSTPFLMDALQLKVFVAKEQKTLVLSEYLEKLRKETISYKLFGESDSDLFKINPKEAPNETLLLNKQQLLSLADLKEKITASLDKKSGVISMSAKMPDPIVAASLVKFSQDYLTKYVIGYRTEKTKNDVVFLQARVQEAKKRYDSALFNYSNYQDRNRAVFLNVTRDEGKKLQYEVDLSYNLYSELTKQLEESKVKIHRETPVFKILEPAQIPLKKSEPKRSVLVMAFVILGGIISVMYIFFKSLNLSKLFN